MRTTTGCSFFYRQRLKSTMCSTASSNRGACNYGTTDVMYYAAIMLDGNNRYQGKWRFVSCDGHPEVSDGPPALYVLPGSNPWWSRVHVRNGSTATDAIGWQDAAGTANGYLPFATNPENAFEVPVNEVLQSGMSSVLITVHYVDGTTTTVILTPAELATESASYPLDDPEPTPDPEPPPTLDPEPTPDTEPEPTSTAHVDNFFVGADGYINRPSWW